MSKGAYIIIIIIIIIIIVFKTAPTRVGVAAWDGDNVHTHAQLFCALAIIIYK